MLSSLSKKTFLGFINHNLKATSQLPLLLKNNNQLGMEPENKAVLLNKQLENFKKFGSSTELKIIFSIK